MLADKQLFRAHAFEYACALLDIDHRLTKPAHPWINGQVERMNRTINEAIVRRQYDTHDQLDPTSPTSSTLTTLPNGSRPKGPHIYLAQGRLVEAERYVTAAQGAAPRATCPPLLHHHWGHDLFRRIPAGHSD